MANISTASGYATFEADTREVVQQLMEAVKPMSENDSYPTDFRWDDDRWPNSEGTRVRVGFVGFGRWAFCETCSGCLALWRLRTSLSWSVNGGAFCGISLTWRAVAISVVTARF